MKSLYFEMAIAAVKAALQKTGSETLSVSGLYRILVRELEREFGEELSEMVMRESTREKVKMDYERGPIFCMGVKIVNEMAKRGYPSKINEFWRDEKTQNEAYERGVTKVKYGGSAHNFGLAMDIVHKKYGWNVSTEYWEQLAKVVEEISERYKVPMVTGIKWKFYDPAHVEIDHWRSISSKWPNYTQENEIALWSEYSEFERIVRPKRYKKNSALDR